MPNVLRSLTDKGLGRNAPDLHSVIRNQTMTAFDELDSCFALSNAAVAEKQDSFTVYLNQHAVPCNTGSQLHIHEGDQRLQRGWKSYLPY